MSRAGRATAAVAAVIKPLIARRGHERLEGVFLERERARGRHKTSLPYPIDLLLGVFHTHARAYTRTGTRHTRKGHGTREGPVFCWLPGRENTGAITRAC